MLAETKFSLPEAPEIYWPETKIIAPPMEAIEPGKKRMADWRLILTNSICSSPRCFFGWVNIRLTGRPIVGPGRSKQSFGRYVHPQL